MHMSSQPRQSKRAADGSDPDTRHQESVTTSIEVELADGDDGEQPPVVI